MRKGVLGAASVGTLAGLLSLTGCGQPPMPDLSGLDAAQAATALRAAEFDSRFTWEESSDEPGLVTAQDPAPGQPGPDPRVVDVTVSSGTPFSADDALGLDWTDAFPLGQSNTPDDDQGSVADQCSALDDVPADDITADGLVVDPYVSPSGVGGGTLLVNVRLVRAASTSAAEALLAANREAQSACAGSAGTSDYNTLPDAGASGNTIEYSAETVAGYPALRTDGFFVVASPSLGGGVGTMFRLTVAWREDRNLVEVTRTEIFGQTLPPRAQGVPDDIVEAVQTLESSVGAEVDRSRANASALRAAKQALKQAKSAKGGGSTTGASAPDWVLSDEGNGVAVVAGWSATGADRNLASLIRIWGQPDSTSPEGRGSGCIAHWRAPAARVELANWGGRPDGTTACSPSVGKVQAITTVGPRWRTDRGLRVGADSATVPEEYANAAKVDRPSWGTVWLLRPVETGCIGDCESSTISASAVVAVVKNGRIARFIVPVGAAGD